MKRVITGVLVGVIWFLVLALGPFWLFWLLVTMAGVGGLYEYFRLVLPVEDRKYLWWSVMSGVLPLLAAGSGRMVPVSGALFVSLLVLVVVVLYKFSDLGDVFGFVARTGFGILYVSFCLAHLVLLRSLSHGVFWVLFVSVIVFASDTGAYYVGCRFGTSKLCPAISPGKTREGAVGGLLAGGTAGLVLAGWLAPEINPVLIGLAALLLTAVGMVGDLVESVIKRAAGVKDSGELLPGHGGLLDRGDSILLAAPSLFYLLAAGWLPGG